jgi:lipopolysaccharide export system protein LptC
MPAQFLSKWKPRDLDDLFGGVARYTRFVSLSKYLLVALGVLLLLSVIITPLFYSENSAIRLAYSNIEGKSTDTPTMINPQLQGVDKDNQPFTINAKTAAQESDNVILMNELNADIALKDSTWMSLNAGRGRLDLAIKTLQLFDNVQLFYDAGYTLKTEFVEVNMQTGVAAGNRPIEVQGTLGHFSASGFKMLDKGAQAYFNGPVAVRLYLKGS